MDEQREAARRWAERWGLDPDDETVAAALVIGQIPHFDPHDSRLWPPGFEATDLVPFREEMRSLRGQEQQASTQGAPDHRACSTLVLLVAGIVVMVVLLARMVWPG